MTETKKKTPKQNPSFLLFEEDANRPRLAMPSWHRLDRLVLSDSLVEEFPYTSESYKHGKAVSGYSQFPITALPQIKFNDEESLNDEMRESLAESRWAREKLSADDTWGVAYVIGSQIVFQGKVSYPMHNLLNKLEEWGDIVFNAKYECWVAERSPAIALNLPSEGELAEFKYIVSPSYSAITQGILPWKEVEAKLVHNARSNGYELPQSFGGAWTPYDYQESAILHLANNKQTLLADQVGLGKGCEFICGFLSHVEKNVRDGQDFDDQWPLVIVTNNSLKDNIAQEVRDWYPDVSIYMMEGRKRSPLPTDVQVIISNVNILSARVDDLIEVAPRGLIVDESHSLKSATSQCYKAARKLSHAMLKKWGEEQFYLVLASATPLVNRPSELYSQLDVLGVGEDFGSYASDFLTFTTRKVRMGGHYRSIKVDDRAAFEVRWCQAHTDRFGVWNASGASNLPELNSMLVSHAGMLRRRKEDVIPNMPECPENGFFVTLSEEDRAEYDHAHNEFRKWAMSWITDQVTGSEGFAAMSDTEKRKLIKAEQFQMHQKLEGSEAIMQVVRLREMLAKVKTASVIDWIHKFMADDSPITGGDETRRKLIVFAEHAVMLDKLSEDESLEKYGRLIIRGSVKRQDKVVDQFQTDPDSRLIICYSGAKEGHTMTAAKDVLIAEMPQGYSPIIQMVGRCYARMSKQFPPHEAYPHFPMVPNSYEARVFASNRRKRAYSKIVVDGASEEEFSADLSGRSENEFMQAAIEAALLGEDEMAVQAINQWSNVQLAA